MGLAEFFAELGGGAEKIGGNMMNISLRKQRMAADAKAKEKSPLEIAYIQSQIDKNNAIANKYLGKGGGGRGRGRKTTKNTGPGRTGDSGNFSDIMDVLVPSDFMGSIKFGSAKYGENSAERQAYNVASNQLAQQYGDKVPGKEYIEGNVPSNFLGDLMVSQSYNPEDAAKSFRKNLTTAQGQQMPGATTRAKNKSGGGGGIKTKIVNGILVRY